MQFTNYCVFCQRFDVSSLKVDTLNNKITTIRCQAFADINIPDEILDQEFDHRKPHPDDNGLQFLSIPELELDDTDFQPFKVTYAN